MVERVVRNDEVRGSTPLGSTRLPTKPDGAIIPPLGGLDITPIVALLAIHFLRILFNEMSAPFLIMTLG